jgi:hypothetical protein
MSTKNIEGHFEGKQRNIWFDKNVSFGRLKGEATMQSLKNSSQTTGGIRAV